MNIRSPHAKTLNTSSYTKSKTNTDTGTKMPSLWLFFALLFLPLYATAEKQPGLWDIQQQWANVSYQLSSEQQESAFLTLVNQANTLVQQSQHSAEALTWAGIVKSSAAGAIGGLTALKLIKAAKQDLEQAILLDPTALEGSALTSLGVLYHKAPGWPVSFGSRKKAKTLLQQALKVSPKGIDANYFYAQLLYSQQEYQQAYRHLKIAHNSQTAPHPPLANSELHDQQRQQQVQALMQKIRRKQQNQST